jgi:hypothetical protein
MVGAGFGGTEMASANPVAPIGHYDPRRLLHEAELLLAYVTSGSADAPSVEVGAIAEAVDAVAAMRQALAAGETPGVDIERRFFATRALLARAAWPATIDSLESYESGESAALYTGLRRAGLVIFILLVLSFLGFSLLNQALNAIENLNTEITKLSEQAVELRENARCDRLGGHNYEVNLRKERIHLAYGTVLNASTVMAAPTLPFTQWRRGISVELYPEQMVTHRGANGIARCVDPNAPLEGGAGEPNQATSENGAHARRTQCWLAARDLDGKPRQPANLDCGLQEIEQAGRAVHWSYANLVLPMLFGTYGGLVATRRRALWRLRQQTLTADRTRGYWMRIGIGAFFGAFLSQVLPSFAGDPLFATLPPFALAFLAGYKTEAVLEMLDRFFNPEAKRDAEVAKARR